MIWHIFKKDWKLLWPLVMGVAAAHVINSVLALAVGFFFEGRGLTQIYNVFPAVLLLGMSGLVIAAIHQDVLPGDRQDWLIRPIRRGDLIAEKLIFVLIAVNGPMFLVDVVHCLIVGLPFSDAVSAALSRGIFFFFSFGLPVLGLAALTSSFIEAMGGFLAIFLIGTVIRIGITVSTPENAATFANMNDGEMLKEAWSVVALAATFAIIPLQYFRRATTRSRTIAFGAVLVLPLVAFIPWSAGFSLLQRLSPDPSAATPVAIVFDPNLGRNEAPGSGWRPNSIWLPLRISGLPADSIMLDDRTIVRIFSRDGALLYRGPAIGTAPVPLMTVSNAPAFLDGFPVHALKGENVHTYKLIGLPRQILEQVRNQPVHMEVDYALTLFRVETSDSIPALNGNKRIPNLGLCRTKIDDDGDEVLFGCLGARPVVGCGILTLKNVVSGRQNPVPPLASSCSRDYPLITAHFVSNAMDMIHGKLMFRDPRGLAKYPVDASQLADAQVLVRTYRPVVHFTRHLSIPEIRLGDWEAATTVAATSPAQ